MNERKAVTLGDYETCLPNLATYFKSTQFAECKWEVVFGPAENFFRCVMLGTKISLSCPTSPFPRLPEKIISTLFSLMLSTGDSGR